MSLLQRITFLTYTVVQHSLFLWLHLDICHFNVFAVENYIFNLYSCILYFCAAFFISVVTSGYIWASVISMSLLQRITFLTCTVVWHTLFLWLHLCSILYFCGYIWLHLGICHFNVFAVENYIFNLYSCAAFFISVVTSGHLSFQCLLQRITFLTCTVVWHSLFLWLHLGICHFNVFAVENYIFNLYSCAAFFISVVTSGHLSFQCLLQRITFLTYTVVWHSLFLWLHLLQASVISMSLLQRITFLTYTVVQHSLFLWLHLGICHFNVFAVENYIFNLYSCVAFFISVVTSGHLSFQCLCCRELHF